MGNIFISHSSKNNIEAVAIKMWLEENGWNDLFLDLDPHQGIAAGEYWQDTLNEAIEKCQAMILLLSDDWLNSDYCLKEYNLAEKLNKFICPVIIRPIAKSINSDIIQKYQISDLTRGIGILTKTITLDSHTQGQASFSKSGLELLKNGLIKAKLEPNFFQWPPLDTYDNPPSPYKGLKPLQIEDAGIFFGREAEIHEFIEQIYNLKEKGSSHFIVVLGASGAGKSSFVRAGILPRLLRKMNDFIVAPIIRPENAVLTNNNGLIFSLAKLSKDVNLNFSEEIIKQILKDKLALYDFIQSLVSAYTKQNVNSTAPTLILTIDQTEELFNSDNQETSEFLNTIFHLLTNESLNIIVINTIRSDSYEHLQIVNELSGIKQQTFSLQPILKSDYDRIIETPAKLLEKTNKPLKIDPLLVRQLLNDLEQGKGRDALPLLAFTLERLYQEFGHKGILEKKDYLSLSDNSKNYLTGLDGIVSSAINQALCQAQKNAQIPQDRMSCLALLRRGFIPWLAGIDPKTKRVRRQVARYDDIPREALPLIDCLIENRLITKDYDKQQQAITIEPTHESILWQWKELNFWLQEDQADLVLLEKLKEETFTWLANANSSDNATEFLTLKGNRLSELERISNEKRYHSYITEEQRNYLKACRTQQEREQEDRLAQVQALALSREETLLQQKRIIKQTRWGLGIMFFLMIILGIMGTIAFKNGKEAEKHKSHVEQELVKNKKLSYNLENQLIEKNRQIEENKKLVNKVKTSIIFLDETIREGKNYLPQKILGQAFNLIDELKRDINIDNYNNLEHNLNKCNLNKENGYLEDAKKCYQSIIEEINNSLNKNNNVLEYIRHLAFIYDKLGNIEKSKGKLSEAQRYFEDGLKLRKTLISNHKTYGYLQNDLAYSYDNLAWIEESKKNVIKAEKYFLSALNIRNKLDKSDKSFSKEDLAISYTNLAKLFKNQNREEWVEYSKSALDIYLTLNKNDEHNKKIAKDLSGIYIDLGDYYRDIKEDYIKASSFYKKAQEILKEFKDRDKDYLPLHKKLAESYGKIGSIAHGKNKLLYFNQSLNIRKELVKNSPQDEELNKELAKAHTNLGHFYREKDEGSKEYTHFQAAVNILGNFKNSDNQQIKADLAEAYGKLGVTMKSQKKWDKAIEYFTAGKNIRKDLLDKYPNDQGIKEYLARSYDNLGWVYLDMTKNDLLKSLEYANLGLSLRTQNKNEHLYRSYFLLGNIYYKKKDFSQALEYFKLAHLIAEEKSINDKEWNRKLNETNKFIENSLEKITEG